MWLFTLIKVKFKHHVRDQIWFGVFLTPFNICSLVSIAMRRMCRVCISVCVCGVFKCVCGDNWSLLAPVGLHCCEPLTAVWFDAERCVLFYHSKVLLWKRGVIVLLKPEPSSDLFVDLWRTPQNNEQICLLPFFPYLYFPLILCVPGERFVDQGCCLVPGTLYFTCVGVKL